MTFLLNTLDSASDRAGATRAATGPAPRRTSGDTGRSGDLSLRYVIYQDSSMCPVFNGSCAGGRLSYFFFAVGLRPVIRPLSVPARSSIMALMSVGLPDRIASSIALRNSSGVVACTPTPPNASISFS